MLNDKVRPVVGFEGIKEVIIESLRFEEYQQQKGVGVRFHTRSCGERQSLKVRIVNSVRDPVKPMNQEMLIRSNKTTTKIHAVNDNLDIHTSCFLLSNH
jgi:hypothetical protein